MLLLKHEKTTIAFRKAVKLYSERHKTNKTLEKLLKNFSVSQVAKLIRIFSNEWIKIPDENKIWLTFRNKQIRDELDTIDPKDKPLLKEKCKELAALFGVSPPRITAIYAEEKDRSPENFDDLNRRAHEIYKEEFIHFQKSVEEALDIEPLVSANTKKRPIIPY